jgi:hypothetical protein
MPEDDFLEIMLETHETDVYTCQLPIDLEEQFARQDPMYNLLAPAPPVRKKCSPKWTRDQRVWLQEKYDAWESTGLKKDTDSYWASCASEFKKQFNQLRTVWALRKYVSKLGLTNTTQSWTSEEMQWIREHELRWRAACPVSRKRDWRASARAFEEHFGHKRSICTIMYQARQWSKANPAPTTKKLSVYNKHSWSDAELLWIQEHEEVWFAERTACLGTGTRALRDWTASARAFETRFGFKRGEDAIQRQAWVYRHKRSTKQV